MHAMHAMQWFPPRVAGVSPCCFAFGVACCGSWSVATQLAITAMMHNHNMRGRPTNYTLLWVIVHSICMLACRVTLQGL